MAIAPRTSVIGLTGPFGSGCSTSAAILAERMNYKSVRLSEVIRQSLANEGNASPTREQLQDRGDQLRKTKGLFYLVRETIERLQKDEATYDRIVVDGIRNTAEIRYLKDVFGSRFFLFAMECQPSQRWERLRPHYEARSQSYDDFVADDKRDQNEEVDFGQQVQPCVDGSDVLVVNDDEVTMAALRTKLESFVKLVTGVEPRFARPEEILMNMAYSASHGSKCLKRQVGAVLVDAMPGKMGLVVGTGFNENPPPTHPCVEEPEYGAGKNKAGSCYRDMCVLKRSRTTRTGNYAVRSAVSSCNRRSVRSRRGCVRT